MAGQSTYFRILGRDLPNRSAMNVKGSRRFIEQVGENVRLADGTRETLRRPQFLKKHAVSISGDGLLAPPIQDLEFGDSITIDFPHPMSLPGEVDINDLDFTPDPERLWYYGEKNNKTIRLPAGDPAISMTMWIPRMTIMIDNVNTDYDDTAAKVNWSIEAEIV